MADAFDFSIKFIWDSKIEAFWKQPATYQGNANFLILLIKLIASIPKTLGFKCNPPLFSSFEVIFPLSMVSIDKPCKCSFVLIFVKETLPLLVRVI